MKYRQPRTAMLVLTHACNLRCRYCFVEQKPQYMTYETAKDAVHYLLNNRENENESISINFFGGEPLLLYDSIIYPLVKYIREELKVKCNIGITTNGILLNDKIFDFFKKYNVRILMSIDGDKETQDYNRPCRNSRFSSFDLIKDKIPKLLNYQKNATFRSTLIPATAHKIIDNIDFAAKAGYNNVFFIPNVFEEWPEEKWQIVEAQLREYSNYYIRTIKETNLKPIKLNPLEETYKSYLAYIKNKTKQPWIQETKCEQCHRCGIGASGSGVSIHPNGNIYSCQELTSNEDVNSIFYLGDIYNGIPDENREKILSLYLNNKITSDTYDCNECELKPFCEGGCLANNYLATGNLSTVSGIFCRWKKLLLNEVKYIDEQLNQKKEKEE